MSDYLWDKTGEPDAETERLEELLGQLRFQPTPFDLPAGLPAQEFRAAPARTVLSWPRLAVAASITLAVLAGAWMMLKQQAATNDRPQVAAQGKQADAGEGRPTAAAAPKATDENDAGGENKAEEAPPAVVRPKGRETRREKRAAFPHRPRVPDLAGNAATRAPRREKNPPTPGVAPQRAEVARATAEREAAEKVLYALRITSEKLNYARQQVHDAARGEDNR